MWIALGIVGFLAALITVILLLPVRVIVKNDDQNELILRYKFLGKIYGEEPNPDAPIIKTLKAASGVERLEKTKLKKTVKNEGWQKTVADSYELVIDLLKEVLALLRRCTITKLRVDILCVGDEADEAAIHYGQCCAITYSLLNVLQGLMRVRKRGRSIHIGCDFCETESVFRYHVELTARIGPVLAALWRVVLAEARRMETNKPKKPQRK